MAVATGREYGLFINGETVGGSSSRDLVEPASGEPFATAQLAGEAEIDSAVEAARGALAGDWGKTPANERSRLLHALADALAANRKELTSSSRGTSARRSRPRRRSSSARSSTSASTPRRSRRSRAARIRSAARSSPTREGAGRRRGADRSLELSAADDHVEARACSRGRLLRRPQAGPADAGDGASACGARGRGRLPGGSGQRRPGRGPHHRRLPRQPPRGRQGRVYRLHEDRRRDHAALLRADQAADARAGREEPEHRLRRCRPRLGDSERGLVDLLLGRPEL